VSATREDIAKCYRSLAVAVIQISLDDLNNDEVSRAEAIKFFESGKHLQIFCGVAGISRLAIYETYRSRRDEK